ncbi:hypothetical protein FRC09_003889 [Ceratobasidium sp. 395]|nr:hypothetical protein FRC09_003889 [Ceratobasidium sp. 395]
MFETFQRLCPDLRSVSLYISSPWFDFGDDPTPNPHSPLPRAMIDMIRASPSLISLDLDFRDVTMDRLTWSPDQLCSNLNATFPDLRVLRMLGATAPDWQLFFEDPEANPYHQFLQRHPKLHTVSIGWVHEHSCRDFSPESVAALFPSLRHFEGPFFICQALASSSIAAQVESLSVLDEVSEGDEMVDFSENAVDMPNLRSLSLRLEDEELDGDALIKVLSLAPSLKKLAVWSVTSEVGDFIDMLKHAPSLEELTMPIDKMLDIAQVMGQTSASALVHELARELPNLLLVHEWSEPQLQRRWVVSRRGESGVHVAYIQLVREGPLGNPFAIRPETIE